MIKAFKKRNKKKGITSKGKGKVGMGVRMGDSIADQIADVY